MKKDNIYNLIFSYLGLIIGFVNTVYRAKVLTPSEIGLITTLTSTAMLMQNFVLLGLPSVVLKFFPTIENKYKRRGFLLSITGIVLIAFVLNCFFYFVFKNLFLKISSEQLFRAYVDFIPVFLFFNVFQMLFFRVAINVFKAVKANMLRSFLLKFFNFTLMLSVFLFHWTFQTYFYLFLIINITILTATIWLIRKDLFGRKVDFAFLKAENIKSYGHYTLFMFLSGVFTQVVMQIDKIMISHYIDLKKTGIYAIAMAVAESLNVIIYSQVSIVQPLLAKAFADKDNLQIKAVYNDNLQFQTYLGLFGFVCVIALGKPLLAVLGKDYAGGFIVLVLISGGNLLNILVGMCGETIALSKFFRFDFYSRILLVFIVVATNMLLIPMYGIIGAAIGTCINFFLYDLLKVVYAYKKFAIHPFYKPNLKIWISAGIILGLHYCVILNYVNLKGIPIIISLCMFYFVIYEIVVGLLFKYDQALVVSLYKKMVKMFF